MLEHALYIVATPIGNLGDITPRALEVLRSVDVIAAEDKRHSQRLLSHFDIRTPMVAVHDHNERQQTEAIVQRLTQGERVAIISDAGTPLISDPGFYLVRAVRQAGFKVVPVPGACALIAALCASGVPTDRFIFEGFLPAKAQAREQSLQAYAQESRTLVCYESPHRILATLEAMHSVWGGERHLVLARELSKTFETFLSGPVAEVLAQVRADANQQKGEMVLIVQGVEKPEQTGISAEGERVMTILLESMSVSQAAAAAAKITGESRKVLYQWALAQQNGASV
ncbi:16S rRNA (cytidine(1402)-2'-O)-methyltransferase [Balneatrix alpica]|uniref:Ribosomal RNA small subunit methyltransferase I n=1 Tax=Balneatrix alpica TaxID=75684 RepID=A0ABV5Z8W9_9GAMM|nr:16S rRNA (cytidine(1402)-2'-O)-methyltransferase [Balneatrix alpica]